MEDHGRETGQFNARPTRDQVERGAHRTEGAKEFMAADAPYVGNINKPAPGTGAAERYTAAPIGSTAGQADITKNPSGVKLTTIKDSGERVQYASGSLRDPSTGKLDWTRITYGPMMRRWAQHLTTAEAKYPDVRPGLPNFMLVETEEELIRYKKSAFRHFMAWFNGETDEDHASAVFFNINGVEIIKDKRGNR